MAREYHIKRLLCALYLPFAFSSLVAAAEVGAQPSTVGVADLQSALAQGKSVASLVALLERATEPVVIEWLSGVALAYNPCESRRPSLALQAAVEDATEDELVPRIAAAFETASFSAFGCLAADVENELAVSMPGDRGFETLVSAVRSSGILDASEVVPASDAFVRQLLDELLPLIATPVTPERPAPLLNPLEPDASTNSGAPFDPNTGGGVIIDPNQPEPPVSGS